jgi:hypothetical protein
VIGFCIGVFLLFPDPLFAEVLVLLLTAQENTPSCFSTAFGTQPELRLVLKQQGFSQPSSLGAARAEQWAGESHRFRQE